MGKILAVGRPIHQRRRERKKVCFLSQQGAFLEAFLVLLMHRINLGRSALAPSPKGSFGLGLTMLGLLVRSNTCKQLPFLDITEYIKIRVSNFVCVRKEKICFFNKIQTIFQIIQQKLQIQKLVVYFDNLHHKIWKLYYQKGLGSQLIWQETKVHCKTFVEYLSHLHQLPDGARVVVWCLVHTEII